MAKNTHNQKVGSDVSRSDSRIKETGEVFTPMHLVYEMIDNIPESKMISGNTFMDNSCGCGNFLVGLKDRLINKFNISEDMVINHMLYGVDLMEDNVRETCKNLGITYPHPHFVVADGLRYHYRFDDSHPYDDEEILGVLPF